MASKENKEGISKFTNPVSIKSFQQKRKATIDAADLVKSVLNKSISALSRAITLIESNNPTHQEKANYIINGCLPFANKSIRIGITGVPGVGKSTFIETLGNHLILQGKKVAVLAVDPSSTVSKGSILGDKTRMENLAKNPKAFIRPSASGNTLGGVAKKTRETIILCEAAGFDVIIIETVGVGQNETTVASMVDFFLLLKLAGAGDELQGIKRGIIEMADAIVINKADGDNLKTANLAKVEFSRALHYYPKRASNIEPQIFTCSALNNTGITDVWEAILSYVKTTKANHFFQEKRNEQDKYWLIQTIENQLKTTFFNSPKIKHALQEQLSLIKQQRTTPFAAANYILNLDEKTANNHG
ncbi:methylmalonyl Co-A mutase-associated GTPase MeaB [Neotamlana sedimentorum]|uniref:methylmalonyl Co-A mutase-associated GTPase MeaB n=1 Tax=Neotamlana sedimentorum TaxID=1435349 RepID=UPI000AEC4C30|nr:methylmalonyl Co-A mutase-associated GTPase MeaB [Tamlana sedimentorum]